MRSRSSLFALALLALALVLAACGGAAATETEAPPTTEAPAATEAPATTEAPLVTEEPMEAITPSVTVSDQDASSGTVVIDSVDAAEPSWIVIHADAEGGPGPVIGYALVEVGANVDVMVEIDLAQATPTLYAMLHLDAGTAGVYEFPGDDGPVKVDDAVVVVPFAVTLGASSASSGETVTIVIKDGSFSPSQLTISVGTTVIWKHEGSFSHTVTSDDGLFDSGTLASGGTFQFTFNEAGTFGYYCQFHGGPGGAGMAATITVTG